jgi:hypothetical protein
VRRQIEQQFSNGGRALTPAYPQSNGTYLWINSTWVSLPHNNGHVTYPAAQLIRAEGGAQNALSGNVQGGSIETRPDKLAELTFDGVEPIPSTDGGRVRIAYIGKIDPPTPNLATKYPELLDYPSMEMAPTIRGSTGSRSANLYRIVPGLAGFRDTRVPAVVEKVSDTVTVLTCKQSLDPGSYVVAAGIHSAELIVK